MAIIDIHVINGHNVTETIPFTKQSRHQDPGCTSEYGKAGVAMRCVLRP